MSRRKQRSTFGPESKFERRRIVAYRDCGLSFREIGSRVGRNQTTVMRICDRWMQEGTTYHVVYLIRLSAHLHQSDLSARRPLLGLPLTQTTDVSATNGAMKERYGWQNGINLSLMTSHASVCNTTMVGFESGDRGEDAEHWFFGNHQIKLVSWPARSPDFLPIENMWSMVAQRLTQITLPAATPDELWQRVEVSWSAVPQEHIQSLFESMARRVTAVIFNNGGYSGY
ncbi:transposable element Tcb1 transposase [Trichonephila clavipes]|nr:transposable element Tcb1 transposase [Trichonephila clavipes]